MTAPTITDDDVFAGLVAFVNAAVPAIGAVNVQQGPLNRVPMPPGPDFCILEPTDRLRLATNVRTYDPTHGTRSAQQSVQVGVTLNFYGPNATDYGQTFTQLFRDLFGTDFMVAYNMAPLFCDDGRQMPLIDSEKRYAARWMIRAWLQINPAISTPQDFAANVAVHVLEIDK